jgi:hypothetical protein
MQFPAKFRHTLRPALLVLLLTAGTSMLAAESVFLHGAGSPAHPAAGQQRTGPMAGPGSGPRGSQDHLQQWMDRHRNLSLPDQQRALANEPGFRDLPPPTQQRMLDQLRRLNNMPPEQRRQVIDRMEAIERLTLPQRQQVRGAMQQLGSLPPDRRRLVARAFRDLRDMPAPQRQAILNSDHFRGEFSEQERRTLSGLIAVEPYLPHPPPREGAPPAR